MKYEIGTEAIVIEAGSHEFELGERIILDEIYSNGYTRFINLDNSDYWFMDLSEIKFIESQFNLADYLPFPKEGLNVILKNGSNAKLYHDLSETDYVGQYPILGVGDTGQTIQFSLSGKVHPYHSPQNIAQIGCSGRTEFPEDMWSVVSTDFNYLCIDEDGDSWFFELMPWIESGAEGYGSWNIADGKYGQNFIIPVSTSNWKMSLIKRPDHQK